MAIQPEDKNINVDVLSDNTRIIGLDPTLVSLLTSFTAIAHSLINKIRISQLAKDGYKKIYPDVRIPDDLTFFKSVLNNFNKDYNYIEVPSVNKQEINKLFSMCPELLFTIYQYIIDSILEGAIKQASLVEKKGQVGYQAFHVRLINLLTKGIDELKKELDKDLVDMDAFKKLDKILDDIAANVPVPW